MHTEEEAKTKWCPKYQVATSGGDNSTYEMDNRPRDWEPVEGAKDFAPTNKFHVACRCVASACMAWRFGPDRYIPAEAGATKVVEPTPGHFQIAPADGHTLKQGYCGLAGQARS